MKILENPSAAEQKLLGQIHALIVNNPQTSFTQSEIAPKFEMDAPEAQSFLEYLAAFEREFEEKPELRGVAKVFLRGEVFYEALSDNPDVRRDYDFRATHEGGRDFCPKNMFYHVWAWINLTEERFAREKIENNKTILMTHDGRYYWPEIIDAAKQAAMLRGYKVVFAFAEKGMPSCVSSYSHAVRLAKPVMAVFITASHLSLPLENTVVGAKISILGGTGRLESIATRLIKIATAEKLKELKADENLKRYVNRDAAARYEELFAGESHTRLAAAGALAAMGKLPMTLYELSQKIKTVSDLDAFLKSVLPAPIPPVFKGLRVAIEGAHTPSGPLAEKAFAALGAQTFLLNGDVRQISGPHKADPSITENLRGLFDEIKKQSAHMGIAFDLDGDRGAIVLPDGKGGFSALSPDRIGQALMPFLMSEGGYREASKPLYIRDCLSTNALVEQAKLSGVTLDTTDAGYVYLKKREVERMREGYLAVGMGEASGHVWLDFTGPFENPIVVALLFAAMGINWNLHSESFHPDGEVQGGLGHSPNNISPPRVRGQGVGVSGDSLALLKAFNAAAIPYRKSTRFQPLFSSALIAEAAASPMNDTGWTPASKAPLAQKIIALCRSRSIEKLKSFFVERKTFPTPLGLLKVDKFETQWDEDEKIFRFGKIYFSLDNISAGSFVSRGSSNDPTAVQVWEVREFSGESWPGARLPEGIIQKRFDLVGGLVLTACEALGILELTDRKPAVNMAAVLESVKRYKAFCLSKKS